MKEVHCRKRSCSSDKWSKYARKRQTRKVTCGMRGSNHPSSNQAFPFLISYQFCGFWKLSFNVFIQVFLQVSWERENTSSTTGWKLWKFCLKSQDVQLKNSQNLTKKLLQYSTASNQEYQKDSQSSHILHPPASSCGLYLLFYLHVFLSLALLFPATLRKPTRRKQVRTLHWRGCWTMRLGLPRGVLLLRSMYLYFPN